MPNKWLANNIENPTPELLRVAYVDAAFTDNTAPYFNNWASARAWLLALTPAPDVTHPAWATRFSNSDGTQISIGTDTVNSLWSNYGIILVDESQKDIDLRSVVGTPESTNGYYSRYDGTFTSSTNYKSAKFVVNPLKAYCVTAVVSGNACALAVYYTAAGVYIGYERIGSDTVNQQHTKQFLSISPTAGIVGLTSYVGYPYQDSYALFFEVTQAILGTPESTSGYYSRYDGVFTGHSNYLSAKFPIDHTKEYYVTSLFSGNATALAIYYNGSTYISNEFIGSDGVPNIMQITQKKLLQIPPNATIVGLSTLKSANVIAGYPLLIASANNKSVENVLSDYDCLKWKNKNIAVFGTSLSISSFGVPEETCNRLGATIRNEAVGSSTIRASLYTGSMVGMQYTSCLRALSHTITEKQSIMDHWATGLNSEGVVTGGGTYGWRDLLIGTPPAAYTTYASALEILAWSYENCLVAKYLNTASTSFICSPDIFLFEHGYNDLITSAYDASDEAAIDATGSDRSTYGGAMSYIFDIILTYNPRARIAIVGHFNNDISVRVYQAQQNVATRWNIPLLKLWEKTGWSQRTVSTTGYWDDEKTWNNSGGSPQTLTMLQIWCQDGIHPGSIPARDLLATFWTEFLKGL
jgi:hypothetical protein